MGRGRPLVKGVKGHGGREGRPDGRLLFSDSPDIPLTYKWGIFAIRVWDGRVAEHFQGWAQSNTRWPSAGQPGGSRY